MRYTVIDEKLRKLAARQYWLVGRRQAFELGASTRFLDRRLQTGDLVRVERSVYGYAGHAMTWVRRLKAAELGTPEAAIAGLAAAALHGLAGFRRGGPEIVVPPGAICRHPTLVVHRQVGIRTTVVEGVRTTTIAQTLFDVAPRVTVWRLERAIDDALIEKKTDLAALEERLAFYEGSRRAGLPRLRSLMAERRDDGWMPATSELEARLYALLDRLPTQPTVVRQASWPWWPTARGAVDAYLPDHRLIVEGDGRRWHTRVADFDRDRWRDNQAAANGLRVMRYTWLHLTQMESETTALLNEALAISSGSPHRPTGEPQTDQSVGLRLTGGKRSATVSLPGLTCPKPIRSGGPDHEEEHHAVDETNGGAAAGANAGGRRLWRWRR